MLFLCAEVFIRETEREFRSKNKGMVNKRDSKISFCAMNFEVYEVSYLIFK